MNRAADQLPVFFFFFCMISSVTAQPCYRVCLFFTTFTWTNYTRVSGDCTRVSLKQILQPAGTPLFLQNLVASPVRHAELEHEAIGIIIGPQCPICADMLLSIACQRTQESGWKKQKRTKHYAGKVIIRFHSITYFALRHPLASLSIQVSIVFGTYDNLFCLCLLVFAK